MHALHADVLPLLDDSRVEVDHFGAHTRLIVPFATPSPRVPVPERVPPPLVGLLRACGLDPAAVPVGDVRDAVIGARRAARRDCDALADRQLVDNYLFHVFPNVQFNLHVDELQLFRHRPHPTDPQRCFFDQFILQRGPARGVRPEREHFGARHKSLGPLTDADIAIAERVQRGVASRGFAGLRLGAQEAGIRHFHSTLSAWLGGPDGGLETTAGVSGRRAAAR